PPALARGVDQPVPPDVPIHRWRDRERVPGEHRLPAGRTPGELSGLPAGARCPPTLAAAGRLVAARASAGGRTLLLAPAPAHLYSPGMRKLLVTHRTVPLDRSDEYA